MYLSIPRDPGRAMLRNLLPDRKGKKETGRRKRTSEETIYIMGEWERGREWERDRREYKGREGKGRE